MKATQQGSPVKVASIRRLQRFSMNASSARPGVVGAVVFGFEVGMSIRMIGNLPGFRFRFIPAMERFSIIQNINKRNPSPWPYDTDVDDEHYGCSQKSLKVKSHGSWGQLCQSYMNFNVTRAEKQHPDVT